MSQYWLWLAPISSLQVIPASEIPVSEEDAEAKGYLSDFCFCGLLSLIDPPRDAVPPAVADCRSAGVGVTMVTGDHPTTAEAIARKCGIITGRTVAEVAAALDIEPKDVPFDHPDVEVCAAHGLCGVYEREVSHMFQLWSVIVVTLWIHQLHHAHECWHMCI
jgi:magnesium-transporting ATPase (P-type)